MQIEWPMTEGGELDILLSEDKMEISGPQEAEWILELTTAPKAELPFTAFGAKRVTASHSGFGYAFDCLKGTVTTNGPSAASVFTLHPANGKIVLEFRPE